MKMFLVSILCLLSISGYADNQDTYIQDNQWLPTEKQVQQPSENAQQIEAKKDKNKQGVSWKLSNGTVFNKTLLNGNNAHFTRLCRLKRGFNTQKEIFCYVERGSATSSKESLTLPRFSEVEVVAKFSKYSLDEITLHSKNPNQFSIKCLGSKWGLWSAQGHVFNMYEEEDMIKTCMRSAGLYLDIPKPEKVTDVTTNNPTTTEQ